VDPGSWSDLRQAVCTQNGRRDTFIAAREPNCRRLRQTNRNGLKAVAESGLAPLEGGYRDLRETNTTPYSRVGRVIAEVPLVPGLWNETKARDCKTL
jgi:hypothetical protein